jgi:hypothetical protein
LHHNQGARLDEGDGLNIKVLKLIYLQQRTKYVPKEQETRRTFLPVHGSQLDLTQKQLDPNKID